MLPWSQATPPSRTNHRAFGPCGSPRGLSSRYCSRLVVSHGGDAMTHRIPKWIIQLPGDPQPDSSVEIYFLPHLPPGFTRPLLLLAPSFPGVQVHERREQVSGLSGSKCMIDAFLRVVSLDSSS